MTMTATSHDYFQAARDDVAGIVPAHLAARRMERRLMTGAAVLTALLMAATVLHGWHVSRSLPDLATFAFRV